MVEGLYSIATLFQLKQSGQMTTPEPRNKDLYSLFVFVSKREAGSNWRQGKQDGETGAVEGGRKAAPAFPEGSLEVQPVH